MAVTAKDSRNRDSVKGWESVVIFGATMCAERVSFCIA